MLACAVLQKCGQQIEEYQLLLIAEAVTLDEVVKQINLKQSLFGFGLTLIWFQLSNF